MKGFDTFVKENTFEGVCADSSFIGTEGCPVVILDHIWDMNLV